MKFLADSNYGEDYLSYSPLRAYSSPDGAVCVVNPCAGEQDCNDASEWYKSLQEAADSRGFIRRYLADAKEYCDE